MQGTSGGRLSLGREPQARSGRILSKVVVRMLTFSEYNEKPLGCLCIGVNIMRFFFFLKATVWRISYGRIQARVDARLTRQ